MSYILDALKKAERERDIRQVPTLMAEHESGTGRRKMPWILFAAVLLCLIATVWLTAYWRESIHRSEFSGVTSENDKRAGDAPTSHAGEPASTIVPTPNPGLASEQAAGISAPSPRAVVPSVPRETPPARTADSLRLQRMAELMAAAARQSEEEPNDMPAPDAMGTQLSRASAPRRAAPAEPAAIETAGEKPASLKEALSSMTLSVLVYDENKADRMVFINGRKYLEGEYVEDTYLLESITLEGAVLTYRGERLLLRPKAR